MRVTVCIASILALVACGGDSSGMDGGGAIDTGMGTDTGTPTDGGGGTDLGTDLGPVDMGPPSCSALMTSGDTCGMCTGSMCCTQYEACQADATCRTFQTCVEACSGGDPTCVAGCMTAAGGSTTVSNYITCVTTTCASACS